VTVAVDPFLNRGLLAGVNFYALNVVDTNWGLLTDE
jgi:hypothetical protein